MFAVRANDGNDRCEPAIIKMIMLAMPKDVSFADYILCLHIVCDEFELRVKQCPLESRDLLIAMYANPVISKKW